MEGKLSRLILTQKELPTTIASDQWIVNTTGRDIPLKVKQLAFLGPKFGLPIERSKLTCFNVIANVEHVLRNIDRASEEEELRWIHQQTVQ